MNKTTVVLTLLKQLSRPVTRQELSGITNIPVNSICSIVNSLFAKGAITSAGYARFDGRERELFEATVRGGQ